MAATLEKHTLCGIDLPDQTVFSLRKWTVAGTVVHLLFEIAQAIIAFEGYEFRAGWAGYDTPMYLHTEATVRHLFCVRLVLNVAAIVAVAAVCRGYAMAGRAAVIVHIALMGVSIWVPPYDVLLAISYVMIVSSVVQAWLSFRLVEKMQESTEDDYEEVADGAGLSFGALRIAGFVLAGLNFAVGIAHIMLNVVSGAGGSEDDIFLAGCLGALSAIVSVVSLVRMQRSAMYLGVCFNFALIACVGMTFFIFIITLHAQEALCDGELTSAQNDRCEEELALWQATMVLTYVAMLVTMALTWTLWILAEKLQLEGKAGVDTDLADEFSCCGQAASPVKVSTRAVWIGVILLVLVAIATIVVGSLSDETGQTLQFRSVHLAVAAALLATAAAAAAGVHTLDRGLLILALLASIPVFAITMLQFNTSASLVYGKDNFGSFVNLNARYGAAVFAKPGNVNYYATNPLTNREKKLYIVSAVVLAVAFAVSIVFIWLLFLLSEIVQDGARDASSSYDDGDDDDVYTYDEVDSAEYSGAESAQYSGSATGSATTGSDTEAYSDSGSSS